MAKGIKTGGRKVGTPNKSANSIKEMAQPFGNQALEVVVKTMQGDDPKLKLTAACEILDRAYGKATQHLDVNKNNTIDELTLSELTKLISVIRSGLEEAVASDIGSKDARVQAGTIPALH